MILFFKQGVIGTVNPIAIVDSTRSDDQYSQAKILKKAITIGSEVTRSFVNGANLKIFSLNYLIHYRHFGVSLGDSLKTSCEISIDNAPGELASLINLQAITGQESVLSLQSATNKVLDPEIEFPYVAIVLKTGTTLLYSDIMRSFIAYGISYNYDNRRVNNRLTIKGAGYDSMVMRLQLAVDLKKELPLVTQLNTVLAASGFKVISDPSIVLNTPVVARYYPPATLENILTAICKDNGLYFDLDSQNKKINLKALAKSDAPDNFFISKFCFRGVRPGAKIISNFSVKDYATVVFEAEIEDIDLFDTVTIYDDSGTDGLFDNFRKSGIPFLKGLKPYWPYDFYVLGYEYMDNRNKTSVRITATNNWLVSNFKLDNFFETAVYSKGLGQ